MNLKDSIHSKKLHFIEFEDFNPNSVSEVCNKWLQNNDVLILDYKVISYGYQNARHKIILTYTEEDKKNI